MFREIVDQGLNVLRRAQLRLLVSEHQLSGLGVTKVLGLQIASQLLSLALESDFKTDLRVVTVEIVVLSDPLGQTLSEALMILPPRA